MLSSEINLKLKQRTKAAVWGQAGTSTVLYVVFHQWGSVRRWQVQRGVCVACKRGLTSVTQCMNTWAVIVGVRRNKELRKLHHCRKAHSNAVSAMKFNVKNCFDLQLCARRIRQLRVVVVPLGQENNWSHWFHSEIFKRSTANLGRVRVQPLRRRARRQHLKRYSPAADLVIIWEAGNTRL